MAEKEMRKVGIEELSRVQEYMVAVEKDSAADAARCRRRILRSRILF